MFQARQATAQSANMIWMRRRLFPNTEPNAHYAVLIGNFMNQGVGLTGTVCPIVVPVVGMILKLN